MSQPDPTQTLMRHFDQLGLRYTTFEHPAVFTVEEGSEIKAKIAGGHTKNLFLKDKDGALFLVCALGDSVVRLNHLHKTLGCARLSFASADLMEAVLGVTPGSVTVFALINDTARHVTLVLDAQLLTHAVLNFHPLRNTATTSMPTDNVLTFVAHWGGRVFSCDFMGETPVAQELNLAG